jgi:hypothetical protein
MVPFRGILTTTVASILLSVALGKAGGQTATDQPTLTTAELARVIARTIDAQTPRAPPGSALEFKSATSAGNVVLMKYLINDLTGFDRFKSNANGGLEVFAGYWCGDESRVAQLRQGVVIHIVYERSDKKDRVKFTFDKSSCNGPRNPFRWDEKRGLVND